MFETDFVEIEKRVGAIDPVAYGRSRNFLAGDVTRLSPYISRGVISTSHVLDAVLSRGYGFAEIEKFAMQLAWRDYFQRVWQTQNLDEDLKRPQPRVENHAIPSAVVNAETGIEAIDAGIRALYETGYVHNHVRMYIASVTCNVGRSHWKKPAQWFYYHLLDADWASNALSWQWTAGAFSDKQYFANQENINKYSGTNQRDTFLDVGYDAFAELAVPGVLAATETVDLSTDLPAKSAITVDPKKPTLIYNFYNLDPTWRSDADANRVLLLEPSHFAKYPVARRTIEFVLKLKDNIDGIQVFVGEFDELVAGSSPQEVFYKEHPTAAHYLGTKDERDWLVPGVRGFHPSFFAYWKKIEKPLKARWQGEC